jgi:hypothetical protein
VTPLYRAGEYAEAADRGRELAEGHPQYAGLLYNLACCESLAGRTADAIKHLRLRVERSEQFRALAAEDSDLDPEPAPCWRPALRTGSSRRILTQDISGDLPIPTFTPRLATRRLWLTVGT